MQLLLYDARRECGWADDGSGEITNALSRPLPGIELLVVIYFGARTQTAESQPAARYSTHRAWIEHFCGAHLQTLFEAERVLFFTCRRRVYQNSVCYNPRFYVGSVLSDIHILLNLISKFIHIELIFYFSYSINSLWSRDAILFTLNLVKQKIKIYLTDFTKQDVQKLSD